MRRKQWILIALPLFFAAFFGFSMAASIDELKDLINQREDQVAEIEREIARYQEQIDAKAAEADTLGREISRLDTLIKKLNAEINLAQRKIDSSELNLDRLSLEIAAKNRDIESRKNALSEILKSLYQFDNESLVEILLKHNDLSDFFGDVEYIQSLERGVKEDLESLKAIKSELENDRAEEEMTKNRLVSLRSELSDRQRIENSTKQNKGQILAVTKNKEAEYQKLLREREEQRAEIVEEIRRTEDQLRLLIDPSSLPSPRPGVLGWPVGNSLITQGFGRTNFSQSRAGDVYGSSGHNGIDLRASVGTPILASEDGIVKATGNSDLKCPGGSYGRWIVIEHPNHLSTLYAHLSFIKAQNGASVKRGEIIGYGGNTGYTTGPHLHFTVYDSRTVELKQSRVCGILPYGGYLDPMIYL